MELVQSRKHWLAVAAVLLLLSSCGDAVVPPDSVPPPDARVDVVDVLVNGIDPKKQRVVIQSSESLSINARVELVEASDELLVIPGSACLVRSAWNKNGETIASHHPLRPESEVRVGDRTTKVVAEWTPDVDAGDYELRLLCGVIKAIRPAHDESSVPFTPVYSVIVTMAGE